MSVYNAIANAGANAGQGVANYFANRYQVQRDQMLDQEAQQQNEFAKQQRMTEEFKYAASLGPQAGMAYLNNVSGRYGVPPPGPEIEQMLTQAYESQQLGGASSRGVNPITPSNYDPASIDTFLQSGRFSDLRPLQSEGIVMVAGVPHRKVGGNLYRITDAEAVGKDAATIAGMTVAAEEDAKTDAIPERAEAEGDAGDVAAARDATRQFNLSYPTLKTTTTDAISTLTNLRDRVAKLPTGPGYGPALETLSSEMQAVSAQLVEQALTAIAEMKEKGVSLTPLTEKEVQILFDLSALSSRYPEANVDILNRKIASAERKLADLEEFAAFVNGGGNPLQYQGPKRVARAENVQGVQTMQPESDGWQTLDGGIRIREKK